MNIFDKAMYKIQEKTLSAPKKMALAQFRKSIPKGLESGKIQWQDDLDKMASDIIDMTGQGDSIRGLVGITNLDIKEILEEIKSGKKG
jgi:hypothetical protein